ncbi:MAG: phosphoribosylaminoimidazolesuccinocarboxamide synthase [Chloroflexi bacterium]|nr:phosphoribosylaminoimidazolesuccinocarboxamide synthase [Chloroflexota bacterium]
MTAAPLLGTDLEGKVHEGKVRELYDLPDDRLLMVATDRISAYDVVMPNGIPHKGEVLTRLSAHWFDRTASVVPNHMVAVLEAGEAASYGAPDDPQLVGRSMVVRKAEPILVECVVRGYLVGSGWAEYQRSGSVCGIELPEGLQEAQQLVDPLFTPTTKAAEGHDMPMTYEEVEEFVGPDTANVLKLRSLALYGYAAGVARERGVIIADTKFEFGLLDGEITLIDEVLTPDSSRFWPADQYQAGRDQPSFDKQYVRDWLTNAGWDREPPAPELPAEVVAASAERYTEAYRLITGEPLPGTSA